jgi:hypothetical protein
MNDETPQPDDDFPDVMADECEMPTVGDYRLSTRPGTVSGGS